jgi:hypothetical protein
MIIKIDSIKLSSFLPSKSSLNQQLWLCVDTKVFENWVLKQSVDDDKSIAIDCGRL